MTLLIHFSPNYIYKLIDKEFQGLMKTPALFNYIFHVKYSGIGRETPMKG